MEENLTTLLKSSFGIIKKFIRKSGDTAEHITVSENYYVIHKAYHDANRRFLTKTSLYHMCRRYLARHGFSLSGESFFKYFAQTDFSVGDIYAFGTMLSACLIVSVAEEITAFNQNKRCNSSKLISSVLSMRKIPDIKTEECFKKLCSTESLLEEKLELYSEMDKATKDLCRGALMKYAGKYGLNDADALKSLSRKGLTLYDVITGKGKGEVSFFVCYALLFIAFSLLMFYYFGLIAFFMILPLYIACGMVCDKIFSHIYKPVPPLRLGLTEVPDNAVTLVVITTLFFGNGRDKSPFDNLEEFYLKNKKKNIYYGILADFPDSKSETLPEDAEAVEYATRRIEALNKTYGNVFSLFLRPRVLNERDNIYSGRERKRGAVCDLVKAIKENARPFAVAVNDGYLSRVKYVLTLDGDTSLPLGGVLDLVNIMLHPRYRPKTEKGRVVEGYGILQPKMKTGLKPSYSTYYSLLRSDEGGAYERASFDRYQTILKSGIFCGKGMFDTDLFYNLVIPAFPEGKILSHDIPEGCILRCMYVPDTVFTDSGPRSIVSYFSRLHRWIRGDVQNCVFLKSGNIGADGKYKLLENIIRHLTPLFSAAGMIVSSFIPGLSQGKALLLFLSLQSYNAVSALIAIIGMITGRAYTPRRFFSVALNSTIRSASNLILEFASVFEYASRAADAFIRSIWRLVVSKKRLLQWVAFSQSDMSPDGLLYHIANLMVSALAGTVMLVFSPYSVYRLAGLIVFLCPPASYILSYKIKSGVPSLTQSQKNELALYASDTFRFFSERVGTQTNHLPPDNVQLSPSDVTAERTSPSNIGLYLLSLAAACDFGFITPDEVVNRAEKTLKTLEKLKKWKGHLYNWYDTRSLEVIGNGYVSTVDSGNLVTMLVILANALKEYKSPEAAEIAGKALSLAEGADFTALYNPDKELFWLGWSEKEGYGEICYDLLMSEIRTTCYYALAKGIVPKAHWQALSRAIVAKNGFIGMASWSGTAFEYFMPQLFLPAFENSFIDESLSFAFYSQRLFRQNRVWGVSESGFYSFDSEMNYQYKAHGVPSLALKKYRGDEFVVSPYSSFIMINKNPEAVIRNLRNLKELGMYGEYGFYEALDLSSEPGGIVRSYMSHHTGMIMIACANACFNNIFQKRFMADKAIAACRELLCEKIPTDVHLYPTVYNPPRREKTRYPLPEPRYESHTLASPDVYLSQRGNISLAASSDGRISMRYGAYLINMAEFVPFSHRRGVYFGFAEDDKINLCAPCDTPASGMRFSSEKQEKGFAFISSDPAYPSLVRGYVSDNGKYFVFETRTDKKCMPEVCFYFEPVLEKSENYNSHPAFSKLFVISSYLEEERIIIFKRRGKPTSGRYPVCAVALGDKKADFVFRTDNEDLYSHSGISATNLFDRSYDNNTGNCINPACVIKTSPLPGGEVRFIIACAYTEKECISSITEGRRLREDSRYGDYLPPLASKAVSRAFFDGGISAYHKINASILWKAGISGDYPLLSLGVYSESLHSAESFILAFRLLSGSFIRCELLFLVFEKSGYMTPLASFMSDCVAEMGCERFLKRKGGIFIVNASTFTNEELAFIKDFSAFYYETDSLPSGEIVPCLPLPAIIRNNVFKEGEEKLVENSAEISGNFPLPRSYIMAGYACGTTVTHKTLGFSFFGNARDGRISFFDSHYCLSAYGEELLLFEGGKVYDLISLSDKATFSDGTAVYTGSINGHNYTVTVYVMPKFPVKVIICDFGDTAVKTGFAAFPQDKRSCFFHLFNGKAMGYRSMESSSFNQVNFVYAEGGGVFSDYYQFITGNRPGVNNARCAACITCHTHKAIYFIGAAPTSNSAEKVISFLTKDRALSELGNAVRFAKSFIPGFRLFSHNPVTNSLYTPFSPYQAAFSRFLGKTGFYQTGGAFGFRDQLQDCLCLVYSGPETVRTHIIRCAYHQYAEGDVMHWWFRKNGKVYGIRSRCSDDLLFLPLVAADYIQKTGDLSLLDVNIRYLISPPLEKSERFESPQRSDFKECLYLHCMRAISRAASLTGQKGLCLMGSCDWNDGFSAVGAGGKGESVFTTLLLGLVCREFAKVSRLYGDIEGEKRLIEKYEEVKEKIASIFEGDRFPRGTFDDGTVFGVESFPECNIDVISQCFAAILLGKSEQTSLAMNTAYNRLFDREKGVFRLFDPPFDKINAGYISAYPPGMRENGGQYTHGALWGVWGLAACGEYDKANEVIEKITPAYHCSDSDKAKRYKLESYALPADIYSSGRGGWSWYTGSAGWYYKIMTEVILGINFSDNFRRITVNPICEYILIAEKHNYRLKIISSKREETATLDGNEVTFPLEIPPGEHVLKVKSLG